MSSKKKNLDDELSDISSDEENIVNFATKAKKDKFKKIMKKNDSESESEDKAKILSKKIKREEKKKKESESENDSEKEEKQKKKIKQNKSAHNNDDEEKEESEKEIKFKKKKIEEIKKTKEDSSAEELEKKQKVNENKKQKKKIIENKELDSDSEESDSNKNKKINNKRKNSKNSNSEDEKEDSDSKDSESDINPKKKKDLPKKEKSEDKEENEEYEEKENNEDEEPKLVKNESTIEAKKEKKSYNSGTWPELFVNNLSYKTTDESLKNYFSKYGKVESTKIVYDKESGRPKGVGFCKFCDASSAAEALKDNDNLFLDGRPIAVSYSNDKKGSAKVRKSNFKGDRNYQGEKFSIFIGNLSFKTNEDGIKNLFEDCGKIIDIRIAKTEEGRPRGFAHVDFDSNEAVENAIEKSGYKLDGRELRIDRTTNKPNSNKGVFGENSYKKIKNKKHEDVDIDKAKKTGKIINTGSKSQKIENSDDDDDEDDDE